MSKKKIIVELEDTKKALTRVDKLMRQGVGNVDTMAKILEQQNSNKTIYEKLGISDVERAMKNLGYDNFVMSPFERDFRKRKEALDSLGNSLKKPWEVFNDSLYPEKKLIDSYRNIYGEMPADHLEWLLGQSSVPEYLQGHLPEYLQENIIMLERVKASEMVSTQAEAARISASLPDYFMSNINDCKSAFESLSSSLGLPSSVAERAAYTFWAIEDRVQDISEVLKPAAELYRSFSPSDLFTEEFLDQKSALELMSKADSYIGEAGGLIREANAFFSSRPGIASLTFSDRQSQIDEKNDFDRLRNLESDMIGVGTWSESALHKQTGELIVVGNELVVAIKKEIKKEVSKLKMEIELSGFKYLSKRMDKMLSPQEFKDSLLRFAVACSRDHWLAFWRDGKDQFVHKPEALAKNLLGAFLNGCFGDIAFVGQEIIAGPGFIDLLVNFMGTNNILELKVVGPGWSVGLAEEGVEQLSDYMEKFNAEESYLILFDGRKTEKGRKLEEVYTTDHGTVHVITVNISPTR